MHEELEARLKEAEKALKDFDYYQDFETSEHLLTIFSQDSKNVILNNASWLVSSLKKSLEREKIMRAALEYVGDKRQIDTVPFPGINYIKRNCEEAEKALRKIEEIK